MAFKEKYLAADEKIYFIAEIGINHNGNFDLAKKMIERSKDSGANAVKFQKRDADSLLLDGIKVETPTGYLSQNELDIPSEEKAFGTWDYPDKRLEFSDKQHDELWNFASKLGVDYIVSPWDEVSLDYLASRDAKVIKIASIDTNNFLFMKNVASKKIPVIASIGMCNWDEVAVTRQIFKDADCPLMFLHCTSAYPCPIEDKNLSCIPIIQKMFGEDVGFSGHGVGEIGTLGAISLGAKLVEKHVTLSRKMSGPDQAASLEFDEFKKLIYKSEQMRLALGSPVKKFEQSEQTLHSVLAKRIVCSKKLFKGQSIKEEYLRTVVTKKDGGILPNRLFNVVNRHAARDLEENTVLEEIDLL